MSSFIFLPDQIYYHRHLALIKYSSRQRLPTFNYREVIWIVYYRGLSLSVIIVFSSYQIYCLHNFTISFLVTLEGFLSFLLDVILSHRSIETSPLQNPQSCYFSITKIYFLFFVYALAALAHLRSIV